MNYVVTEVFTPENVLHDRIRRTEIFGDKLYMDVEIRGLDELRDSGYSQSSIALIDNEQHGDDPVLALRHV